MVVIAVTGPRKLSATERVWAREQLTQLLKGATHLHVGDAAGLDALAAEVAAGLGVKATTHHSQGRQGWQLAKRSRAMVDALAKDGGILVSWPNKPCPEGLTVSSWKGSGTWGTTRYAVSKGLDVELKPLMELEPPEWLETQQLTIC